MYYNMPYQVNRFEFQTQIEDDTRDMFHCLALTLGQRVRVYSKHSPSNEFILEDCVSLASNLGFIRTFGDIAQASRFREQ